MNHDFYSALYEQSTIEIEKQRKRFNQCSLSRMGTALAAFLFLAAGCSTKQVVYYVPGFLAVIGFLLLIRLHNQIEEKKTYETSRKEVAKDYLDRFESEWKSFEITGEQYLSKDDPKSKDLDLFGPNSVYQYICTASTPFGTDCLASWLKTDDIDLKTVKQRQEAVKELAEKKEFSAAFQAIARTERAGLGSSSHVLLQTLTNTGQERRFPFPLTLLIWILPVITLASFFLCLFGINQSQSFSLAVGLCMVQLLITWFGLIRNKQLFSPIYRFNNSLTPYRRLIEKVIQEEFTSEYLKALQDRLNRDSHAEDALKELSDISNAISSRYNLIAFFLYNSLFLFDFHCARRYLDWKLKYSDCMEGWLKIIGEFEALMSLGVLGQVKETAVFPELLTKNVPSLSVQNLKHPLISESRSVGNNISIKNRTCIITGSNMSGKTTFLRSIGVNLTLAYAGGYVAADRFLASQMKLCTSMRVEDSVSQGISTFYAELLRIKNIIDESQKPFPMIALIDEIYKGTNSKDRIIGAQETIKRLSKPQVLTLVTTHDFELCDLEHMETVDAVNYHFTEHYSETELLFDYKIRNGRCTTTNAQHLLRMVGILPSVHD